MPDHTEDEKPYDLLDGIIRWEDGLMSEEEEKEFFENLVRSGMVYQLQGMYGRRAHELGLL